MKCIYTNQAKPSKPLYDVLPVGRIFECEAESAMDADNRFLSQFGFGSFMAPQLHFVTMFSPEWPCCVNSDVRVAGYTTPLQEKKIRIRTERLFGAEQCWYCGQLIQRLIPDRDDYRTRDHVIPRSRGGRGGANVVSACKSCNRSKASHCLEDFRKLFAMLKNMNVGDVKFHGEK